MNEGWQEKRLDELGFVGRGKSRHRPRNDQKLYGGPYPFIQTADIMGADPYIIDYSNTYTEFGLQQSKMWSAETLCITIAGANTAETAILKFEACFPDSIVGFIPDKSKSNIYFIKYALDFMKERFRSVTRGATQDNLSLEKLLSFPILTPPLSIQSKIANVLSAYDDLVANNNNRISLLEEIIERIYREWFVNFCFEGCKGISFGDFDVGKIPKGWTLEKLSGYVEFVRGVEPGSANYKDKYEKGLVPFLRVGDMGDRKGNIFIDRKLAKEKILNHKDIVVSFDGTIGIVRRGLMGAYSTGIRKVFVKKELPESFVYLLLRSDLIQRTIRAHATGTTILHAGSSIKHMQFVKPTKDLLSKFDSLIKPMLDEVLLLQMKNELIKEQKDILLPKLISGEIDVSELDIELKVEANVT